MGNKPARLRVRAAQWALATFLGAAGLLALGLGAGVPALVGAAAAVAHLGLLAREALRGNPPEGPRGGSQRGGARRGRAQGHDAPPTMREASAWEELASLAVSSSRAR